MCTSPARNQQQCVVKVLELQYKQVNVDHDQSVGKDNKMKTLSCDTITFTVLIDKQIFYYLAYILVLAARTLFCSGMKINVSYYSAGIYVVFFGGVDLCL